MGQNQSIDFTAANRNGGHSHQQQQHNNPYNNQYGHHQQHNSMDSLPKLDLRSHRDIDSLLDNAENELISK